MKLTDAQGYFELHQDIMKYALKSVPKNVLEAKKELKEKQLLKRKGLGDMISVYVDNKYAGFVNLKLNNDPVYKHSAIIGYGVHPDFREMGLATAIVAEVMKYAIKKYKLKRIVGYCRSFNKSSARVMEKCGFVKEATLKKNKFRGGKYIDDELWAYVK